MQMMTNQGPTKARILSETTRLFADQGYEATTVKDIADAVGIKAASLYAHFRGKEELFRGVFEAALASWELLVKGIFQRAEGSCSLEAGLDLILGDFASAMAGSVAYRFWARIYVFPPMILSPGDRARIAAMDRSFGERLGAFCGARVPAGFPASELELLSTSLMYFAMGILMYADFLDEQTLRRRIRRGIAFHLKAIQAPSPRSAP